MAKIYCSRCKYYENNDYGESCRSKPIPEDTPNRRRLLYAYPDKKNKGNHCVEFELKAYLKFMRKIREFVHTVSK